MSDSVEQVIQLDLQLKEGAYTRVERDLTEKPRLYAVDQQGGPAPENKVNVWKRRDSVHMVFCVKLGQQNYLLREDGRKLTLETTLDKPDLASLTDNYWFYPERAAPSQQYRFHSKVFPRLCLIKEEDRHLDLGETTTSSVAVFVTPEKIIK